MTSWQSLLACSQADVTYERIESLIASIGTETVTVEFKEKATPRIVDCVAAMANLYGGLILVGVTDADHKIVGVKAETMTHVADFITTRIDPSNYLPEIFEVAIPGQLDRHIVVVRVRPELASRPLMVQRTIGSGDDKTNVSWMPVRTPGAVRQATRAEMAALFAEQRADQPPATGWQIGAPTGSMPGDVDFMLRTGLYITPGPAAPGRPLSERLIATLCALLSRSALTNALVGLTHISVAGANNFDRRGRLNNSTAATLTWGLVTGNTPEPVMASVSIKAPDQYGYSHIQSLEVIVEATVRLTGWINGGRAPDFPTRGGRRRLDSVEWFNVLDGLIGTLCEPEIVRTLADLADTDPIIVPAPRDVHIVSGGDLAELLPPLTPFHGAGGSHGSHLRADPTLDLTDKADRAEQVTRWIIQMALDAGLRGMEQVIAAQRERQQ
jgi:hypothetical protein